MKNIFYFKNIYVPQDDTLKYVKSIKYEFEFVHRNFQIEKANVVF